ncbi:MAG TPA: ZIP family metal transporter [Longimicrobiales bacterium]|nr:ZIP family metal transporter [Longimicrobiales bacterium]
MASLDPLATVLAFSALAAFTAVLGAVPQALRSHPPRVVFGWANALAAGLMLGVAYTLLTVGLDRSIAAQGGGALLGVAFVRLAHAAAGTGELDLEQVESGGPEGGYKAILVDVLHAADEGVAIGAAMAVSIPLGVAMALTLAIHNIPEAMLLNAALARRGLRLHESAAIAVATNLNQPLLAVFAFVIASRWPPLLPWVIGFAVGTLMYRTLVELLPESYRQAGRTSIAMVTLLAMGVVVLLAGAAA